GSRPNAKNARILNTMVGYQDMGGRIPRYGQRVFEKAPAGKGQRDAALTKRWMDAVGVDVAVLFPTPMLALGVHPQVEVQIARSRAPPPAGSARAGWRTSRGSSRCSICRSTIPTRPMRS